ncbi:MAG TPA: hypothetical protein VFW83_01860 [Bryobacteraceae bacterium]|nr:hypothetical protein [Bryobacteraceae bacterium]
MPIVLAGLFALGSPVSAAADEDFHVYTDPPRLLLTKQRLRLLQRERERQSARWQQFGAFIEGGAPMPEPGFAEALYYRVSGDASAGRKAVGWALGNTADASADLRQLALVFDWCGPVMSGERAGQLAAKIERGIGQAAPDAASFDMRKQSARALAAIAIADRLKDQGESVLLPIVTAWRASVRKRIAGGDSAVPRDQIYAMMELLHAIRDNLSIDLRESAPEYFKQLPLDEIAAHYPAPFPGPANEYFIPVYVREGAPDLGAAALSRAAALALVAFDSNALETQYLQGWLMQDSFTMRDPLGAVYEFLWANRYQPGLSYALLPLVFHNASTGDVFARTSWDTDASWIGYFEGHLQEFANGKIQTLRPGAEVKPMRAGDSVLMRASAPDARDGTIRLRAETGETFVMGLAPRAVYDVEIDDEEMSEQQTDAAGTLVLRLPPDTQAGVRIRRRSDILAVNKPQR